MLRQKDRRVGPARAAVHPARGSCTSAGRTAASRKGEAPAPSVELGRCRHCGMRLLQQLDTARADEGQCTPLHDPQGCPLM